MNNSTARLGTACWTSAGDVKTRTDDQRSPIDIDTRIAAVAGAGFSSFGISVPDLRELDRLGRLRDLHHMVTDHGLDALEIEYLDGWFSDGPVRDRSDSDRELLLRTAEFNPATLIKVGGLERGPAYNVERVARELAQLAQQAADVGTVIAVEPMPFADISTPWAALELVERSQHPAAGLFLDTWHIGRAGIAADDLTAIDGSRIFGVELNDAPAMPPVDDLIEETFDYRLFPGEGELDVVGIVQAIAKTGYRGVWGVEMLSTDFRAMPVDVALSRAHAAALHVLEAAGVA